MPVVLQPWWCQCWLRAGRLGLPHFYLGFPMVNTHMCLCTVWAHRSSNQSHNSLWVHCAYAQWTSRARASTQSSTNSNPLLSILSPCVFLGPQVASKHYWTAGLPRCETWPEVTIISAFKTLDEKLLIYWLIPAMTQRLFPSLEKKKWRTTTCIQQWHYAFWKFTTKFPKISYHYLDLQDSMLWIIREKEMH